MNNLEKQGQSEFLNILQARAATRSEAVASLSKELLTYRGARAVLAGPALTDWTVRYEQNLRKLIVHAVDSVNDVFDSSSWAVAIDALRAQPTSERSEDVMARFRTVIEQHFGDDLSSTVELLNEVVAGSLIETVPSVNGVDVTLSRENQKLIAFRLNHHRATGDAARISSAAILERRPHLVIGRKYGLGSKGDLDFYGGFLGVCSWLLSNARREVRSTQRYGRVRVHGEAPLLIALLVWAILATIAWAATGVACAVDSQSSACSVLKQIASFISIFGFFVAFAVGGAAMGGGPAVDGITFNLN